MHRFYGMLEDGKEGAGWKVVPHLQGAIAMYHYGMEEWMLIDGAPPSEIARIQACKVRNASSWLRPVPLSVDPLSDEACRLSHKTRLGIPLFKEASNLICMCGEFLKTGAHFLGCTKVKGV